MENKSYNTVITVNTTAKKAFEKINRVKDWWGLDIEGSAQKLNDVFTIHFGDTFVTFKVVEFVPGKKTVWLVTDSYLPWLKDKTEWTGTKTSWQLIEQNGKTQISFIHIGLVPGIECYNNCEQGWNFYIKTSLLKLINENKGQPNTPRAKRQSI